MPRSRIFFTLVLILLLINSTFFLVWYGLGGRKAFRNYLASQISKAVGGEFSIGELHFSDRQLTAKDLSYSMADSSLVANVQRLQVRYNLWSFIFSGFKPNRLVKDIDILQPQLSYNYTYKPKPPKAKKPFKIPDIAPYFKRLSISNGSVKIGAELPLKILQEGKLKAGEELSNLNLTVINNVGSMINLEANTSSRGLIKLSGILLKGRIVNASADISDLRPKQLSHPDLQNFSTELSIVAKVSQDSTAAPIKYEAKAQIWNTRAWFAELHDVHIPYLGFETNGRDFSATLSSSTIGSSRISAEAKVSDPGKNMKIELAEAEGSIDLGMILPQLSGAVDFSASASGTLKKPLANLLASSPQLSYLNYSLGGIKLTADYKDDVASFQLPGATFENQEISLSGTFEPGIMALDAHLSTAPFDPLFQPYAVAADIDLYAMLLDKYPLVNAVINNLDGHYGQAELRQLDGYINLAPYSGGGSYFVDASLKSANGYSLEASGDLLKQDLVVDASFVDLLPAEIYAQETLAKFDPLISGSVKAILSGGRISASTTMDVTLQGVLPYHTSLDGIGSYDLKSKEATLFLDATQGNLNDHPLQFSLGAFLQGSQLRLSGLKVNDQLSLSGRLNLKDFTDSEFSLGLWNVNATDIVGYYPDLSSVIPDFSGLNLFVDYNLNGNSFVDSWLHLESVDLLAITPVGIDLGLKGPLDEIAINGSIRNAERNLLDLVGTGKLKQHPDLDLVATFHDLMIQNVLIQSPVLGSLTGKAGLNWRNIGQKNSPMEVSADFSARDIFIGSFLIQNFRIKGTQFPQKLMVEELEASSEGLFNLSAAGAIDYNAIKNEYFEGSNLLSLSVNGQLFYWLKNLTDYIQESSGNSSLTCSIGTLDEQFLISGGNIDISDGFIRLQDQAEPLSGITLKGTFDKNRVIIERGQVQMGEGKLVFNNFFEAESTDHFMLGFLDLGILRLLIEEPGILASIPMFSPKNSISNITLKGKEGRYATIKGPFDQLSITGDITLSSSSVVYPPDTDNLLKLASGLRSSTRKSEVEPAPLPFNLDVNITLGDNVKYVTYPANIALNPGGFLHLLYDGMTFTVKEARFVSESGTIDIFGSVFQADKVDITMIDSQNLFRVDGIFFKRAPDGSLITLSVSTSNDLDKSLMDRLEFSLTSDNPEDRNISQILARLRYSGESNAPGLEGGEDNGGLQDDALNLITGNLDSSLLTPILFPVENFMRRKLKLDDFSINAGFIQNLYTQYSNDSSQLADYADFDQFSTDIAQFSSSILLNNLSVSMSKYLGRRFFLDYKLELQEATDLQKKTTLMITHGTSVRLMLPWKLRLGYTFEYTPQDDLFTHEVMIQRSFNFWGF